MRMITRVSFKNELLLINIWSVVLILIVTLLDVRALRVAAGLPFLLFFPGYVLAASLFPKKGDLGAGERLALSVGLSVILTSGIGLILSVAWEIRLYPILITLTVFVGALSAIAWYRRRRCAEEDRPVFALSLPFGEKGHRSALESVVSVLLVVATVGAVATLAYAVASPLAGEAFTEFYILGGESLPRELAMGDVVTATMGIVNHEHEAMSYRIEPLMGGRVLPAVGPIELDDGGRWEGEITVAPVEPSARTRLTEAISIPGGEDGAEVTTVRVEATTALDPGDHIMIGQEAAVVRAAEGDTVTTEEGLREDHPSGVEVVELQRAEFRLFRNRELGDEGATSLDLWVGKDRLRANVRRQGAGPASYRMDVRVSGGPDGGQVAVSVTGPPDQSAAEVWTPEVAYPFSEMNEVRIRLYADEQLAYETSESVPYPSLYVWLVVT